MVTFTPPLQPQDIFEIAGRFFGNDPQPANGLAIDRLNTTTGTGSQGQVPNNRAAVSKRNLMHWLLPDGGVVQMYINPQNVRYVYKKSITNQRTKGGYVLQYWGEELSTLNLTGTTGTSGIEGINVLHDLYRHEQLAFDPFALALVSKARQENASDNSADVFGINSILNDTSGFISSLLEASQGTEINILATETPTLASLAFTMELYWSGEIYRGYFTDFSVTENAERLGLFDYEITFMVTQKRGLRSNFLGWHRSAVSGPSNSNPIYGTPYSFSQLASGNQ